MNLDNEQLRKALVSLSVEKTLLKIGKPVYDKVVKQFTLTSIGELKTVIRKFPVMYCAGCANLFMLLCLK